MRAMMTANETVAAMLPFGGYGARGVMYNLAEVDVVGGGGRYEHKSVLAAEVVEMMEPGPGKVVADLTLGGGGHSELLLEAGATVYGFDQDAEAMAAARRRLQRFGERFIPVESNFEAFGEELRARGQGRLDGILMDLGVSSHQIDTAERGFSFQKDGPLSMRMDGEGHPDAADLVNSLDEEAMAALFRRYGEERKAKRIARAIVRRRQREPFTRTLDLADCIEAAVGRSSGMHPATRVFQALRIAVNRELTVLEAALEQSIDWLAAGGRLVVISFHSLEDRIVKQFMRRHCQPTVDRPEWPAPRPNPDYDFEPLGRRARFATAAEVEENPRARSARLRAAIRRELP